jgi:hypothetical protein
MSTIVFPQGDATITVPAGGSIAVASYAEAQAFQIVGFPNFPEQSDLLGVFENNTITVFGPFTAGATIQIQAGATEVLYNVGTAPTIPELGGARSRVVVTAVDVTGPITSAAIMGGVVTSAAAAVTGTLPTGAVLDAAVQLAIGDALEWSIIKTGANTFTVADAVGHTIVGTLTVATVTSGRFLTVKTAAATFVSYRVG